MGRVKLVLGAGLALAAVALGITMAQSPISVAQSNISGYTPLGATRVHDTTCQTGETLPAGISAVRLSVDTFVGPRVTLALSARGRTIAHGERRAGWTGASVTVPVTALASAVTGVRLCFTLYLNGHETAWISGEPTTAALAAHDSEGPVPGRVKVEYMRAGRSSWWSLAPQVVRRMGLGRLPKGSWSVFLVLLLMVGIVLTASRLVLRELR